MRGGGLDLILSKGACVSIFHPLLFGLYPILALLATNILEIPFSDAVRALWISELFAIIVWLSIQLLVRNWQKSALVTTLFLLFFYSYGHIHNFSMINIKLFGHGIRNHRNLVPLMVLLFALGIWAILKRVRNAEAINKTLNYISVLILVFPLFTVIKTQLQFRANAIDAKQQNQMAATESGEIYPNIYVFILDRYARSDFLAQELGIDNSDFLQNLEDLGFYVAECSQSNYQETNMVLASMLNFDYLQNMFGDFEEVQQNQDLLNIRIRQSEARRLLESKGYQIVAFETGYDYMTMQDADHYLAPDTDTMDYMLAQQLIDQPMGRFLVNANVNEFEWMYLETTGASFMLDVVANLLGAPESDTDAIAILNKYRRTTFVLDQLRGDVLEFDNPKFVFVHLISPHPPIAFNRDGSMVEIGQYNEHNGYPVEIDFLDAQLIPILENIINSSDRPPVIIVQGDTGPVANKSVSTDILNAYYLPQGGNALLYPTITPVNSFRLIFSQYLGENIDLIEDLSYSSSGGTDYNYSLVPNERSSCNLRFP